jgi:ATP-dependent DNA helicase DinG
VVRARREAMAADLVVVNHHLFFADLALRDSGVAELLPSVDAAVFDEAHQLPDAGVQFLGTQVSTGQLLELGRDLLAQGLAHARGLQPWAEHQGALERAARELRLAAAGPLRELRGTVKLRWEEREAALAAPLQALAEAAGAAAAALAAVADAAPDLARLAERAQAVRAQVQRFDAAPAAGRVRWVDLSPQQARLVESPLDIRDLVTEQRARAPKAWVFTSATLGDDEALTWFCRSAALEDATRLRVDSPFDYPSQARLWVPAALPAPDEPGHPQAVGALAARLAAVLDGRTFVLTTTLRALQPLAQALQDEAARLGASLAVLVQGSEPRRALLQRYGAGSGCVLVASASFWEGIDMPGEALQCVVIDKLPFPPPNDPLVQARVKQLREQGASPFDAFFLPEAAVALKQGAGRLIRSETDRGLLVLADTRIRRMGYGRRLLAALPPMAPLQTEPEALQWLAGLRAAHAERGDAGWR